MARLWNEIDWTEGHYDVTVVDETGRIVCRGRIGDDLRGSAAWSR